MSELESVNIDDIIVGDRFRKDLGTPAEIEDLMESINQKGLIQPITIDQDLNLLAGGRRLHAHQKLGLKQIDCIMRDVTGELDSKEIELFENLHRKSMTWSEEAHAIKAIESLYAQEDPLKTDKATKANIAKEVGKSRPLVVRKIQVAEMLDILPELAECKTEDEAVKKFKKLQSQLVINKLCEDQEEELEQEVVKDPKHVIRKAKADFCIGDALEGMKELAAIIEKSGQNSKLKFAEVDPPYGIDLKAVKKRAEDNPDDDLEKYNEVEAEDYPEFLRKTTQAVYDILAPDAWCIWWFGMSWFTDVKINLARAGFKFDPIPGIWYKGAGQTMNPEVTLARTYEPFFICRKGTPSICQRGRGNVFHYSGLHSSKKHHPTEKPLELMMELFSTFTSPGDKIVVPFLGSGVTLRAAYVMQCGGFGWEMNSDNKDEFLVKVAEDEWQRQQAKQNAQGTS